VAHVPDVDPVVSVAREQGAAVGGKGEGRLPGRVGVEVDPLAIFALFAKKPAGLAEDGPRPNSANSANTAKRFIEGGILASR
jgi:hypothetical protein